MTTRETFVVPHSQESEQSVLGGLMLQPDSMDRIAGKLTREDFYAAGHGAIYAAIETLLATNKPVDVISVAGQLEQMGELVAVGGLPYIGQLVQSTPSAANIARYAELVLDASRRRALLAASTDIHELALSKDGRSATELIDTAQGILSPLADTGSESELCEYRLAVVEAIEGIDQRFHSDSDLPGISTGLTDLDEKTGGLCAGDLWIIAGRPSMGKTTLAMNIAEHVGEQEQVLVVSLEMKKSKLALRTLSRLSGIPHDRLRKSRTMEDADWPALTAAAAKAAELKIEIMDVSDCTPSRLRAIARRQHRKTGLRLLVVDYLQLMSVPDIPNLVQAVSAISRSLKGIAKELGITVIALSQLSRDVEKRPNKRPMMSDLRESGAIEQDADVIAFVYRDEVYHPDSPEKGTAEAIIGKLRDGAIGIVRLMSDLARCRFLDLSKSWRPDERESGSGPRKPRYSFGDAE